jgi:rhamnosyltransferase
MKVAILLSTYNGSKYLESQLTSILNQDLDDEIHIYVRDDGSTDGTKDILNKWQARHQLTWAQGDNIGSARSFLHLLQHNEDADFYAFADQDDVWMADKISVAVNRLKTSGTKPAIYVCQTQMTDQDLNQIATPPLSPLLTFGESLIYAFASGCTMVMNDSMRKIVNAYCPQFIDMHDKWIMEIATAIGADIYFDKKPHILYRQHERNAIGLHDSFAKEWKLRIHRVLFSNHIRYRMATELKKGYYHIMPKEQQAIIILFLSAKNSFVKRLQLLNDRRFRCGNKKTNILFKLAVLLNTY